MRNPTSHIPGSNPTKGDRTRERVLTIAVDLASAKGLDALTIGRLAQMADMSKSGLYACFKSKEALQFATLHHAQEAFRSNVWDRVEEIDPGVERLYTMLDLWIAHIETSTLKGGCFFSSIGAEFDSRPGMLRDNVQQLIRSWIKRLEREITTAQRMGEIDSTVIPRHLAFALHSYVQEANLYRQLMGEDDAFALARHNIKEKLETVKI